MATLNVQNPSTPYLVKLNGPLLNRRITVEGRATSSAVRFSINLSMGGGENSDVALHFDVRFTYSTNPPQVIRNTRINGVWRTDYEDRLPSQMPFKQGEAYKVQIVCEKDRFMLYKDGEFLDFYKHRLPLANITHLDITDGTTLSLVKIDSPCDNPCDMASLNVQNPCTPYLVKLNGSLLNRRITVEGCVTPSSDRFAISLKLGGNANSDVALTFNPRFTSVLTNPLHVIRNSMINGVWGTEELRHSGQFPFKQGGEYKVQIVCEKDRFMMYVNGEFFDHYNHRLPFANITHLEISDGTTLSLVKIDSPCDG